MAGAAAVLLSAALLSVVRCQNILDMPVLDITLPDVAPGPCHKQARILATNIHNNTLWASKMWDASAKAGSGLLAGSMYQLGSFDECLMVEGPIDPQYCIVNVHVDIGTPTTHKNASAHQYIQKTIDTKIWLRRDIQHWGVCVPAECTADELQKAFSQQLNRNSSLQYNVTVLPTQCTTAHVRPITVNQVFFGIFIALLLVLTGLGTWGYSGPLSSTMKYFSLTDNFKSLIHVREDNDAMGLLHGVKVLSMTMIVFGHKILFISDGMVYNYESAVENKFTEFLQLLSGSYLDMLVDTFFFISGMLITYLTCSKWNKKGWFPLALPVVGRIIRLSPLHYTLVWAYASGAIGLIGSGPYWNYHFDGEQDTCGTYWWANILYIENYMPISKLCLMHTWYLGADVHFFVVAMVMVPLLIRKPTYGKALLVVVTLVASVVPPIYSYLFNYPSQSLFEPEFFTRRKELEYLQIMYYRSHMRVTIYLIGIGVGYYLHSVSSSKYIMSKYMTLMGVLFGLLVIFTTGAIATVYYTHTPSRTFNAVYGWVRRPLWILGLGSMFVTQRFSHPNFTSRLFSCSFMQVISKLSYTMYLIHVPFLMVFYSKIRVPPSLILVDAGKDFCGDMAYLIVISGIVYVVLELPAKRFLSHLLLRKTAANDG